MGTRPGAPRGPLSSICSQGSRRQLPWGEAQGEEGGTALYSARALGAPSATAPNPQAATAFQINSLALPGSLSAPGGVVPLHPGPGCPSQVHVGWPLPPQSRAHLHSGHARLLSLFLTPPLTLSHSLPLFLKSFCFSHMPVLSLTGSFSLFPPLFLPAFGLSPRPCQGLATRPPLPDLPALRNPA